jgi:hypothetical protein
LTFFPAIDDCFEEFSISHTTTYRCCSVLDPSGQQEAFSTFFNTYRNENECAHSFGQMPKVQPFGLAVDIFPFGFG